MPPPLTGELNCPQIPALVVIDVQESFRPYYRDGDLPGSRIVLAVKIGARLNIASVTSICAADRAARGLYRDVENRRPVTGIDFQSVRQSFIRRPI